MENVVVFGGSGTLGCQILFRRCQEWDITVFSRDEYRQSLVKARYPEARLVLGDVRDYVAVEDCLRKAKKRGPVSVIVAAALKRVEFCEQFPWEAVKTNVEGVHNVLQAVDKLGIDRLVYCSTDKVTEASGVYGMTKSMAEKMVLSAGFNATRHGNVLGSRGSVVEIFRKLAARRIPLPVTDPDMTRFVVAPGDAFAIVEKALLYDMAGAVFVRSSPAVRLETMARCFSDDVTVVGLRPGEKMDECLISADEGHRTIRYPDGTYVVWPKTKDPRSMEFLRGNAVGCEVRSTTARMLSVVQMQEVMLQSLDELDRAEP